MDRFRIKISDIEGDQLWGRDQGKSVRDKILDKFTAQQCSVLLLDFTGVKQIDYSCASEIVSVIILRLSGELKNKHLLLTNLSEWTKENIEVALEKAELCCIVLNDTVSGWEIIGKYSDALKETLSAVVKLKQADSPTISAELNITLTTCNNRLKSLVQLGMVKREELSASSGGKQYRYDSIL